MRPVYALLVYLGLVFWGGALLAPWAYSLVHSAASSLPALQSLASEPFHRYVSRTWMLLGVIGLPPFLRASGIRSWNDLGLSCAVGWRRLMWHGFLLGFGSLALIAAVGLAAGTRTLVHARTPGQIASHLVIAGLSAIIVAVLEEIVFRGALFGALRKACRWETALVLSSSFYALVHFFQRPAPPDTVDWASGLALLPRMMRGFGDIHQLLPGFLNLTLVGMLLGFAYHRTGNLFYSIGLHAGWIFWLKSYTFLTDEGKGANVWLWGSGKLIDGWFSLLVLSGVLIWCHRTLCVKPNASGHETTASL